MTGRLAGWLQVLGNLGLVLGLILVGVQIKQNSDLTRAQIGHDAWLQNSNWELAQMGESPHIVLAKIWFDPKSLSDEELVAADHYFHSWAVHMKRVEYSNDAGISLYSEELIAQSATTVLENRIGRAWWNLNREAVSLDAPRTAARIDEILTSPASASAAQAYYQRLRAGIGAGA